MEVKLKHLEPSDLENFESKYDYPTFKTDMLYSIGEESREVVLVTYRQQPLIIVGVNYMHSGVGELWAVPSVNISKYPKSTVQITKTLIEGGLFHEKQMRRLFFYIKNSWIRGHKWARYLGFNLEGIAQAYNEKYEDYAIYAKIRQVL